jgi:hypothetical protein
MQFVCPKIYFASLNSSLQLIAHVLNFRSLGLVLEKDSNFNLNIIHNKTSILLISSKIKLYISLSNLRDHPSICLEGLTKTTKNFSKDSREPGRNLNLVYL